MKELIYAIARDIAAEFEHDIYIEDVPEGFIRPSFFIYLISSLQDDINRFNYNDNILMQIVYFSPLNAYKLPNRIDQLDTIDKLKSIFSNMVIMVEDKAVKIAKVTTGYTADKDIYIQLELDKTTARINEETTGTYELMQNIDIEGGS